jgi:PKD repeat protein
MLYVLLILALVVSGCAYNGPTTPSRPPTPVVEQPPPAAPPTAPTAAEPVPIPLTLSVSPVVRVGRATYISAYVGAGMAPTKPVDYRWTFGDGQTAASNEGVIAHTYAAVGTFETRVRATDATRRTGEAVASVRVTIAPEPPPPEPPPTQPTPTLSVTLNCSAKPSPTPSPCNVSASYDGKALASTAITSVAWDWGDGTTIDASSSGPLKQHTYSQAGVYLVVVNVTADTSAGQKTASMSKTLTIN